MKSLQKISEASILEALKAKLREDIGIEGKRDGVGCHFKDQIVDQLLQKNSFEIPPSLVEDQNQALVSEQSYDWPPRE